MTEEKKTAKELFELYKRLGGSPKIKNNVSEPGDKWRKRIIRKYTWDEP